MDLLKAQCSPEKREKAKATYDKLLGTLNQIHSEEDTDSVAVRHLIHKIEASLAQLRPFIATETATKGGSSSRVLAGGLKGEQGETVDVPQTKIQVTMADGRKRVVSLDTTDKEGNPIPKEELDKDARNLAMEMVKWESENVVTKVAPRGKAAPKKSKKPTPNIRDLGPGLHRVGSKPGYALFQQKFEDGSVSPIGRVSTSVPKKQREQEALRIISESRAAEKEDTKGAQTIEPRRAKKKSVPEREIAKPSTNMQEVPDYPNVSDAHNMTPSEFRKEVNEFYRKNNVLGSLRSTAAKEASRLRRLENATDDPKRKQRLQNMRSAVQDKLKEDIASLKEKVSKRALDKEHRRLVEKRLERYHASYKASPKATQTPTISRDTIKYHNLDHLALNDASDDADVDVVKDKERKKESLYRAARDKRLAEAFGVNPRTDIYRDELPEFEDFPEQPRYGGEKGLPIWKKTSDEKQYYAKDWEKKERPINSFKSWVDGFRSSLSEHRESLLDKYGIPKNSRNQNADQKEFLDYIRDSENQLKEDMARKLREESDDFGDLSDKEQQHILGLIKKSVDNSTSRIGDVSMLGLFLDINLFKALPLGESQKIKAFKNSFGRTSSGVNPPTMNTGELEAEEEKEAERKDKKEMEKSLNLYVSC